MPWTVKIDGGPRRVNHAAVAVNDKIFSFGGYCTGGDYKLKRPMDVHILNTINYRWQVLNTPDPSDPQYYNIPYQRYGHTAVVHNELIYIWGGRNDDNACDVLFCFDTNTGQWSKPRVRGQRPRARDGHTACIIEGCMYVFGGYEEETDQFSQDVHKLDLETMEWSYVATRGEPPSYRDFHSATAIGRKMYIFGGRGNLFGPHHTRDEIYCNQMVYLDIPSQRWYRPNIDGYVPIGRRSHSAFCYKGNLFIFGGFNGLQDKHFNDLLRYNPENCRWSVVKPKGKTPCPRRRQSCCVIGDRVFLFGGTSPNPEPYPAPNTDDHDDDLELDPPEVRLMDHNDLYVLDFSPSLKTLAISVVLKHKLNFEALPESIRYEIRAMTLPNHVTKPLVAG